MEGIQTKQYQPFYRQAFDFHKRWMPCPDSLEEWEACCTEMCAIANQADNNPFLMDLLCAVYTELERNYKSTRTAASDHKTGTPSL